MKPRAGIAFSVVVNGRVQSNRKRLRGKYMPLFLVSASTTCAAVSAVCLPCSYKKCFQKRYISNRASCSVKSASSTGRMTAAWLGAISTPAPSCQVSASRQCSYRYHTACRFEQPLPRPPASCYQWPTFDPALDPGFMVGCSGDFVGRSISHTQFVCPRLRKRWTAQEPTGRKKSALPADGESTPRRAQNVALFLTSGLITCRADASVLEGLPNRRCSGPDVLRIRTCDPAVLAATALSKAAARAAPPALPRPM